MFMPPQLLSRFQLTRPRGTRHDPVRVKIPLVVSTHASAGDATASGRGTPRPRAFQLTRPRGTRQNLRDRLEHFTVSTHASAGDATTAYHDLVRFIDVSTHASAGDATTCTRKNIRIIVVSTHASAGDATHIYAIAEKQREFQLTRPRGTRRARGTHDVELMSFNSRVRGGRDDRIS